MNPQDLFDDIKAMRKILDELKQRDAPVTAKQLAELTKQSPPVDPQALAVSALKAFADKFPNTEHIKVATDASVTAIAQVGDKVADHIRQTGDTTASKIARTSRSRINEMATYIGFSSWQSAVLIFSGFFVLVAGAVLANQQREEALAQSRSETRAVREFTDWVKAQPEGKRLYERYYNP